MDTSLSAALANLLLTAAGAVLCILGFVLLNARRPKWALVCVALAVVVIIVSLVAG